MTAALRICTSENPDSEFNGDGLPVERISVLLMDDSAFDRKAIARIARRSHFEIELHETSSVAETRALLTAQAPDIVFLDFRVPDGDGIDLAREISSGLFQCAPPVVIVTGEGDEGTAARSLRSGAVDYLAKDALTQKDFDDAVVHALASRTRSAGSQNPEMLALQEELTALRAKAQVNMNMAKSYLMPMAQYAWQSVTKMPCDVRASEVPRLRKVTERLTGFLDETLVHAETACRDLPVDQVDLFEVAELAVASSADFRNCVRIGPRNQFPVIMANWSQVLMLVNELCREAVLSVPKGTSPKVSIDCAQDPNGNPVLCVTDNGISLEERQASLARLAKSTGSASVPEPQDRPFAMSLCQKLAELMGGQLRVRDADAGGCTTMVRLSMTNSTRH
ncbi:MAG: response regulator [Pseudomonadota bacterium]